MGSINNFTVTEANIKQWITRYGEIPQCSICNEPLKPGDEIETKNSGRVGTRRFHEDCMYSVPRSKT